MERKGQEAGICGVVADLIQTDKRYETAIETALGGSIQNVVTEDEETAKRLIQYLKQNRYGRVTFLPLTAVRNPQEFRQPQVLKEPGVLAWHIRWYRQMPVMRISVRSCWEGLLWWIISTMQWHYNENINIHSVSSHWKESP